MSIARLIMCIDDSRKLAHESYQICKENQKIGEKQKDFDFAKLYKKLANESWDRVRLYDKQLAHIGVYTGTQERDDWK